MNEFYNNSPFGKPQKAGLNGEYFIIDYVGGPVADGQVIHLGWSGPSQVVNLSPVKVEAMSLGHQIGTQDQPPAIWTYNGKPLGGQKIPALGYNWRAIDNKAVLRLTNATPESIRIHQIDFAVVSNYIPLSELNWDPLEHVLEWKPFEQSSLVLAGTDNSENLITHAFEFPFNLTETPNQYLVYRVWADDGIDEGNFIKALGQASIEQLIKDSQ